MTPPGVRSNASPTCCEQARHVRDIHRVTPEPTPGARDSHAHTRRARVRPFLTGAGCRHRPCHRWARTCNGTARDVEPCRRTGAGYLPGDGACRHGLNHICCVRDLDLAGLCLLGDGDGQHEHAVFVGCSDVVTVEALSEEQLAAEVALGPFCDLDLIALSPHPARVARTLSRSFSTVSSMKRASTPGRSKRTVNSLFRRYASTGIWRARRSLSIASVTRSNSRNGSDRISMAKPLDRPRADGDRRSASSGPQPHRTASSAKPVICF